MTPIGRRRLDPLSVFVEGLKLWFGRFGAMSTLSLVLAIPVFLLLAFIVTLQPEVGTGTDASTRLRVALIVLLVSATLSSILSGGLVVASLRLVRGGSIEVGDVLRATLARFGALVGFALLVAVFIAVGFIFLIVPGLVLLIVLLPGLPALYAERLTATEAVRRSFRLVRFGIGTTFGVALLGVLFNTIASIVVGGLLLPGSVDAPSLSSVGPLQLLVQLLVSALLAPLVPVLQTALYIELRGRETEFPVAVPDV